MHHCICLLPILIMLTYVAATHGTGKDLAEYYYTVREMLPATTTVLSNISRLAIPAIYLFYLAYLLDGVAQKDKKVIRFIFVFLIIQVCISFLLVRFFKITVGAPRPFAMLDGLTSQPLSMKSAFHSFPSGHTTEAVATILPLVTLWRNFLPTLALGCTGALIGYSRLYLGMHHIADLLGGIVFGSCAGFLVYHFCRQDPSQ